MADNDKPEAGKLPESGTVTVACNLPTGHILELCKQEKTLEPVMGGGTREVEIWTRTGQTVTIHGPALAIGAQPKCLVIGGYALTPNVDAQFWNEWLKQNARNPVVMNGCVKAFASTNRAEGWAKEHAAQKSGLEPLIPGVDAKGAPIDQRVPRSTRRGITNIDTEVRAA